MLPKPTITILPGNFTCTSWLFITFFPCLSVPWLFYGCRALDPIARLQGGARLAQVSGARPRGATRADNRAARMGPRRSGFAPVRRVGVGVTRERLDARNPAGERGIVPLHGQEPRTQLGGSRLVQSPAQQLDPGKDHHIGGGVAGTDDPQLLAQTSFD